MINQLRDYLEAYRVLRPRQRTTGAATQQEPAVDARYSYRPTPNEEWTVENRRVLLNGRDMDTWINDGSVGEWCHLIDGLAAYRDWLHHRRTPRGPRVRAVLDQALEKVLKRVHRHYHQHVQAAQHISIEDERVLLNNLDIRAVLAMFAARPTIKARTFLQGVQRKLALILSSQQANPQHSRTHTAVRAVYHELSSALARETIDQLCLPSGDGPMAG